MRIASIGIDLGKTTLHLVALAERSKVVIRKKVFTNAIAGLYGESVALADWPRGVLRSTLFGSRTASTRARSTAHPRPVRKALPQVQQKRLPRCGSDRRSRDQTEHAFCANQDRGATRRASHAPRSGSTRATSHGTDQQDPRLSVGAWHHLPSGVIAMPPGATPAMVAPTVLVAVSMTETVLLPLLPT